MPGTTPLLPVDRWLSPAGGLVYHLRALRHRPLWRAYSDRLAGWLQAWNPPCRELVLIGPSAGWTLPAAFLAGFGQVHVLEPDPLARRLLGRRFADAKLVFDRLDCLCDRDGPARLARAYPDAALLFANVLGQQVAGPVIADPGRLRRTLAGQHWASCHDVLSAARAPHGALPDTAAGLDAAALAERLWGGSGLEICDHDTLGLGAAPGPLALWPLTPRAWHVIEWIVHAPAARADQV